MEELRNEAKALLRAEEMRDKIRIEVEVAVAKARAKEVDNEQGMARDGQPPARASMPEMRRGVGLLGKSLLAGVPTGLPQMPEHGRR